MDSMFCQCNNIFITSNYVRSASNINGATNHLKHTGLRTIYLINYKMYF